MNKFVPVFASVTFAVCLTLSFTGLFVATKSHATQPERTQRDVVVLSAYPQYYTLTNDNRITYYPAGYAVQFLSHSAGVEVTATNLSQALADLMTLGFRIEHVTQTGEFTSDPGIYTLVR